MGRCDISKSSFWTLLMIPALSGCLGAEAAGKIEAALSQSGPWDIPEETLAIGDTQVVEYTGAGSWRGPDGCAGGPEPGTQVLGDWLRTAFPQALAVDGYACRPINGDASRMSVHATGRALDIMLPLHADDADNDLGDPIGNWLIEHAEEIGIQFIIWDQWTWQADRPAGHKGSRYRGASPHYDHLHVEISLEAAAMETAWFAGPMEPPPVDGCAPVTDAGGIVDNSSRCFAAFGDMSFWREVTDAGEGGSLLWTNAFQSDMPSNWARWRLDVDVAGEYAVEVSVDPAWGVYDATRYGIHHGGEEDFVMVDQGASDGWNHLGVYRFAAGRGQHVSVYDNAVDAVPPEQRIVADAVRLVPMALDTMPPDGGLPSTGPVPTDGDPLNRRLTGGCSAGTGQAFGGMGLPLAGIFLLLWRRRRPIGPRTSSDAA